MEEGIEEELLSCADWRMPWKKNRFVDNKPGRDWWERFKRDHPVSSEKFAQNVKRSRVAMNERYHWLENYIIIRH